MPRYSIATLNHSPMHGLQTKLTSHLESAGSEGIGAIAPDIFWLRKLEEEGLTPAGVREQFDRHHCKCMEIAGIAIGDAESTAAELVEHVRWSEALGAEFVNARVTAPTDDAVVARARDCAEALAQVGTRLALEFSRGTKLNSLSSARAFAEAIDVPGVGVTLDTWHFFLHPDGPEWDALEEIPPGLLANVQLSDGVPYGEGGFADATMNRRCFPGEGDFDLKRASDLLAERKIDPPVVLEVLTSETRDQAVAVHARDSARSAIEIWGPISLS